MKEKKERKVYVCSDCGFDAPKWSGQCPNCGSWNTMNEMRIPASSQDQKRASVNGLMRSEPKRLSDIEQGGEKRFSTGIGEFDRVLGGGAVAGSLVLVGGAPGIGKSTLLLQACKFISETSKVLYVSGEESPRQLKMRAERLGVSGDSLFILSETDIDDILTSANELSPDLIVMDSIQTASISSCDSTPGSVSQVKECTMALMRYAKSTGVTVFIVGHVNKDGAIAGPKVLEHMVDCVLYFEGEKNISYRLLRAAKNRFGSTNEVGVFDMDDSGLTEIENPSAALLSGMPKDAPGSCVACTVEGTRPLLAEVQALVTRTSFGIPRRMAAGVDYNRAVLLMAIIEKRAGLLLSSCDAYVNVTGGLRLDEPAIDLPVALAIASSFCDRAIIPGTVAFGEMGLTGEMRTVHAAAQRINEVHRLGFSRCIVPYGSLRGVKVPDGLEIIQVRTLSDAMKAAIMPKE